MSAIILPKGQSIKFLDYTIKNSSNNDGLVLFKENGQFYELHLGNYGIGDEKSLDNAKQAAICHFILARPQVFASSIMAKIMNGGSTTGTHHEYYKLLSTLKNENIDIPEELTPYDNSNLFIGYKNQPLNWIK